VAKATAALWVMTRHVCSYTFPCGGICEGGLEKSSSAELGKKNLGVTSLITVGLISANFF